MVYAQKLLPPLPPASFFSSFPAVVFVAAVVVVVIRVVITIAVAVAIAIAIAVGFAGRARRSATIRDTPRCSHGETTDSFHSADVAATADCRIVVIILVFLNLPPLGSASSFFRVSYSQDCPLQALNEFAQDSKHVYELDTVLLFT